MPRAPGDPRQAALQPGQLAGVEAEFGARSGGAHEERAPRVERGNDGHALLFETDVPPRDAALAGEVAADRGLPAGQAQDLPGQDGEPRGEGDSVSRPAASAQSGGEGRQEAPSRRETPVARFEAAESDR